MSLPRLSAAGRSVRPLVLIVRTPPAFRAAVAGKGLADTALVGTAFAGMMSLDTVSVGILDHPGTAGAQDSVGRARR